MYSVCNVSLWEYEQLATDGFREVAENGDITVLETELKQQVNPNIQGNTNL